MGEAPGGLGAGDAALAIEDELGGGAGGVGGEDPAVAGVVFGAAGAGFGEVVGAEGASGSLLRGLAEAGDDKGVLGAAGEEFGVGVGELEGGAGPVGPIGVGRIGEIEEFEGLGEGGVELVEVLVAGLGEGGGKIEPAVAAVEPAELAVAVEAEVGAGVGGGEEGFP
jgi:hypothetical protein